MCTVLKWLINVKKLRMRLETRWQTKRPFETSYPFKVIFFINKTDYLIRGCWCFLFNGYTHTYTYILYLMAFVYVYICVLIYDFYVEDNDESKSVVFKHGLAFITGNFYITILFFPNRILLNVWTTVFSTRFY